MNFETTFEKSFKTNFETNLIYFFLISRFFQKTIIFCDIKLVQKYTANFFKSSIFENRHSV